MAEEDFEKEAEEYAKEVYGNRTDIDHYGIPEAFQNGAEFGYNKAKEEIKKRQTGMAILPTVQFKRMDWNEDKLWTLIKRLKNDVRTKDLFSFSEDKFGRFDFIFNG